MHEKLLTTPIEQKEKTEYLKELLIREKTNNELIKKLKDEQAQAQAEKEREVNFDLYNYYKPTFFNKTIKILQ
jgi:transcription initiation factor TFIIIB Brf1 subunit/transcription initiation factor TFIIB